MAGPNRYISVLLLLVVFASPWRTSWGAQNNPVVTVSSFWSQNAVTPGEDIALAVVLETHPPFHISAKTARIEIISSPPELRASTPIYPASQVIEVGPGNAKEKMSVFSPHAIVFIQIALSKVARLGQEPIKLKLNYQACDDKVCLVPTSVEHEAQLSIVGPNTEVKPLYEELFRAFKERRNKVSVAFFGWDFAFSAANLWLLLLVAAIGGLLLNFTPCVLPLIPIKIMGLARAADSRSRCLLLGAAMSMGVVAFWMALAIAVRSISGFDATNKLFQYPAFTIAVGLIICVMAVGMFGLFSMRLPAWAYRFNPSQETVLGSVLFGLMAALLSTPCTAPFMGAAVAWAATQNSSVTMATFAAIGMGMALPYLFLSAFPILVRRVPKTGPANELIKQTMGLLLLAAGVYFFGTGLAGWLTTPPDPPTQNYWWGVAFFIAAAGGWLAWRTIQITAYPVRRTFFAGLGLLLILIAAVVGTRFTRGSPINWIYYTPERLTAAQAQGKIVALEFTAAWCLNCRALEEAVLHDSRIVAALNSPTVAPIKVDITGNNPAGDRKLLEEGRRAIPYLVIYSSSGQPVFASDAYSVDQVQGALKAAQIK